MLHHNPFPIGFYNAVHKELKHNGFQHVQLWFTLGHWSDIGSCVGLVCLHGARHCSRCKVLLLQTKELAGLATLRPLTCCRQEGVENMQK